MGTLYDFIYRLVVSCSINMEKVLLEGVFGLTRGGCTVNNFGEVGGEMLS